MKPLLKVNGNTPGPPRTNSLTFFIKSLLKVNGNALGACWADDLPASQPTNQRTLRPGWLAAWLAGSLGWLAGWLAAWPAGLGWPVGWKNQETMVKHNDYTKKPKNHCKT